VRCVRLEKSAPMRCVVDVTLNDGNGVNWIKELKSRQPENVRIVSRHARYESLFVASASGPERWDPSNKRSQRKKESSDALRTVFERTSVILERPPGRTRAVQALARRADIRPLIASRSAHRP